MKLSKKKVFVLALAVCLIAILSMGSLAWFTDTDSVTNDFLIAGSEDQNPDDVFSVDVWEKNDPNSTEKEQTGLKYDAILPGDDLYKEVNIENTGSYEQYIRATVTVTGAHIWQEIFEETYVPLLEIAPDLNPNFMPWSTVYDQTADTLTYVLYFQQKLPVDGVVTLFTQVLIPEALDQYQAAELAGGFQISVVADAVQTKNVGADAAEAFETVGMAVKSGNYSILRETTIQTQNGDWIREDTIMEDVVINSAQAGLQTAYVDVVLNNTEINAGSSADYSNILYGGSVVYNNVDIASAGGGIGALDGAQVTFNGGSLNINSASTSQRYHFYVDGEGTKVVVNDGTFTLTAGQNLNRAYAYVGAGSTLIINGGNFGAPTTRYPAGLLGDGEIIITGGTFGFNPSAWVADGYEAVQNGSTWTVQAK